MDARGAEMLRRGLDTHFDLVGDLLVGGRQVAAECAMADRQAARGTDAQRFVYLQIMARFDLSPFWFAFSRSFDQALAELAEIRPRFAGVLERHARGETLRAIGRQQGVSGARIQQINDKALRMIAEATAKGQVVRRHGWRERAAEYMQLRDARDEHLRKMIAERDRRWESRLVPNMRPDGTFKPLDGRDFVRGYR